ncbi:hypothetical protein QAD02_001117 [Eretmocerus hayati]|uniref:Uncharacterized protein n=1 Tax=Eretmocerus hayati TaxID=131215 RepID=A0ACC2NGF6_9HYME|nr:hypothetical protein QAD02_001117 [Eretmocerus hayati]
MPPSTRKSNAIQKSHEAERREELFDKRKRSKKAIDLLCDSTRRLSIQRPRESEQARQKRLEKNRTRASKRRLRIKNDPVAYAIALEKDRQRKRLNKQAGKWKSIKELSERDQRARRKYQKNTKRAERARRKANVNEGNSANLVDVSTSNTETDGHSDPGPAKPTASAGRSRAFKNAAQVRRRRCYRDNAKLKSFHNDLQASNKSLQKKVQALQKQNQRLKVKAGGKSDPLRAKIRKYLQSKYTKAKDIEEKLISAEILRRQIRVTYWSEKDERVRKLLRSSIAGHVTKKYKLLTSFRQSIVPQYRIKQQEAISQIHNRKDPLELFKTRRQLKKQSDLMRQRVREFYSANSAVDPSKRGFIKINGEKVQKQYLQGSLRDLYAKFCSDDNLKMSYSSFCKYKLKNCVEPKLDARDTCACIIHMNFDFMTESLSKKGVISENSAHQVAKSLICETRSTDYYSRECRECQDKEITFNTEKSPELVSFNKWKTVTETRTSIKSKKEITVTVPRKETLTCTVEELIRYFLSERKVFMKHEMRVYHQEKTSRARNESLGNNVCSVVTDFSQNYLSKYNQEWHRVHFGAGREQYSIFTGVLYTESFKQGFVSASASTRHDASAILAHLFEILDYYLDKFPLITDLDMKSDGPSSQYKNKTFFFLLTQLLPLRYKQIKRLTYNYSESGHGKGPADGIGATVKRAADDYVRHGGDIPTFQKFYEVIKKQASNVHVSSIKEEDIESIDSFVPSEVKSFNGTRQVYQFTWNRDTPTIVQFNTLSCFECAPGQKCNHFHKGVLDYKEIPQATTFNANSIMGKRKSHEVDVDETRDCLSTEEYEIHRVEKRSKMQSKNKMITSSSRKSSRCVKKEKDEIYAYD